MSKADRLGPVLFQLPPNFQASETNRVRLADLLAAPTLHGLRIAFEFRHESWFTGETYQLLRARNAALCIGEGDDLTAPDIAEAEFR